MNAISLAVIIGLIRFSPVRFVTEREIKVLMGQLSSARRAHELEYRHLGRRGPVSPGALMKRLRDWEASTDLGFPDDLFVILERADAHGRLLFVSNHLPDFVPKQPADENRENPV